MKRFILSYSCGGGRITETDTKQLVMLEQEFHGTVGAAIRKFVDVFGKLPENIFLKNKTFRAKYIYQPETGKYKRLKGWF